MNAHAAEIVGTFRSADLLEEAAEGLMSGGFDRSRLSLRAAGQTFATNYRGVRSQGAIGVMKLRRLPYIDHHELALGQAAAISAPIYIVGVLVALWSVVSRASPLATVSIGVVGLVLATGLGFAAARVLGRATSRKIERELAEGGLVLWVRIFEPEDASRAWSILSENGASDLRALDWRR